MSQERYKKKEEERDRFKLTNQSGSKRLISRL